MPVLDAGDFGHRQWLQSVLPHLISRAWGATWLNASRTRASPRDTITTRRESLSQGSQGSARQGNKSAGIDDVGKVMKTIYDIIAQLDKEQVDDDRMNEFCPTQFDSVGE